MTEERVGQGIVVYTKKGMPEGRAVLPVFDKIVVQKDETPEKIGRLFVPDTVRDQQPVMTATVVATGPEVEFVAVGDYVVVGQYSGSNVKVDGMHYTVVREQYVHVIIR